MIIIKLKIKNERQRKRNKQFRQLYRTAKFMQAIKGNRSKISLRKSKHLVLSKLKTN
jgi:hypothetical protein